MLSSKLNYRPYHRRRGLRWLGTAGIVVLAFLSGVFAGRYLWEYIGQQISLERDEIARKLAEAESVISQLKMKNAVYENASLVDQLAVKNTQEDLKELQGKLRKMGKELEFYRRIVSPSPRDFKLRIQSLRMFPGQQFALTLSQGIGKSASIQATARMQFAGRLNGEQKVLKLSEVDSEGRKKLEFSFRYYQTQTASVRFPPGFELESVTVTATPRIKHAKKVSRVWSIKDLESESEISVSAMGDL
jgi:hypothetical protein